MLAAFLLLALIAALCWVVYLRQSCRVFRSSRDYWRGAWSELVDEVCIHRDAAAGLESKLRALDQKRAEASK